MNIPEENIRLAPFSTFKIGGDARYFLRVKNIDELKSAVSFAKKEKLALFVLGGGSNTLMSDEGFSGVVVKIEINGVEFSSAKNGEIKVSVGAGENWDDLVKETVKRKLFGLENLSGIPGSVGAAPVQNIGAYGAEVKDTISEVEVLNSETGEIQTLSNSQCEFAYRDSIFKHEAGKKSIITKVVFKLKEKAELNLAYKDVQNYILEHKIKNIDQAGLREAILSIRSKKFPDLAEFGTAGSFFKNPIIHRRLYQELTEKYPKMPAFPVDNESVKIPAGWLFDVLCGFKGYRKGDAGVFQNQALVLVNWGKASAKDILLLAEEMRAKVKEKTGIEVEFEVNVLQ